MAKWIHVYRMRLNYRQGSTRVQISDNEMIFQAWREKYGNTDEFFVITYDLQPVKVTGSYRGSDRMS